MAFNFCQHCGTKHEYTSSKPNFCTNCGASFAGGQSPQTNQNISASVENDTSKDASVPTLSKFEYEITNNRFIETTLGSVIKEEKLNISSPRKRHVSKTGDAVQDCIEQCRPVRGTKDIDE